jgi:tetratricopeptide (TPR) repeat protein
MWKELTRKNPLVTRYHLYRASNLFSLGNLYLDTGRLPKAEESYKQAQAVQERLVADFPTLAQAKRDLTDTYTRLADVYRDLGRRDQAERMHLKNLETCEQLYKDYPATIAFQYLLAISVGKVAGFYREDGRAKEAEAAYGRKIGIYERLIKKDPRNPAYECGLGLTYNDLGRLYRPLGRTADAEKVYLQALTIQDKLVRENPKVADYRVDLATTQHNLGNVYRQVGQKDKAEDYYRIAIRGHESLVHDHPEVPLYARELARSYDSLAVLFLTTGRLSNAEPLIRQAVDVLGKLAENQPGVLAYHYERAQKLLNLCEIYNHSERNAEAEAVCKEMLPLLERLARENPKFVMLLHVLGLAQRQMGEAVSVPGRDLGEAVRWYSRAIATLKEVAQKAPEDAEIREGLAAALEERSKQFLKLARATAALKDLDRAVKLSAKRTLLLTIGQMAARSLAKDHAGTAAKADELAGRQKASAFLAYNAACVNARSAAVVREDEQLSVAEKDKLFERYMTRALEWLRKARAAAYFRDTAGNIEALKTESDLALLWQRNDFKKWLSEVKKSP